MPFYRLFFLFLTVFSKDVQFLTRLEFYNLSLNFYSDFEMSKILKDCVDEGFTNNVLQRSETC